MAHYTSVLYEDGNWFGIGTGLEKERVWYTNRSGETGLVLVSRARRSLWAELAGREKEHLVTHVNILSFRGI